MWKWCIATQVIVVHSKFYLAQTVYIVIFSNYNYFAYHANILYYYIILSLTFLSDPTHSISIKTCKKLNQC